MKSKIIKVSIVLIFMMFSAGLFNFCFAWEISSIESRSIITGKSITELKIAKLDVIPEVNENNIITTRTDSSFNVDYFNLYNTNGYVMYITSKNELALGIFNDTLVGFFPKNSFSHTTYLLPDKNNSVSGSHPISFYVCIYNDENNQWVCSSTNAFFKPEEMTLISSSTSIYGYDTEAKENYKVVYEPIQEPSIKIDVNQTGSTSGNVTFTPENWDSHMYYIKDDMDELTRLIAEEELSPAHNKVKLYNGPIAIEKDDYVMGILFDSNGTMIFSEISKTLELDSDIMFDDSHRLRIDKSDLDTYYLFIHSPQDGDYIKVSSVPNTASDFNNEAVIINGAMTYNGLSIRDSFINGFNQLTREINITKNTVNYFYLYDVNNNLVDSAVLNTSNYYDGSDFNFDVELQYGSSSSRTNPVLAADDIGWCKVIPTYSVDNVDDLELYFRMVDYYEIYDGDSPLFVSKDDTLSETISYDTINKSTDWIRIDNQFNRYFYICTMINDNFAFFELELRTKDGQVLQNKGFSIYITPKAKNSYTGGMTVDGESVLDNVLSGVTSNNGNFDFSGLNKLSEDDLKTNLTGLIDNSIGFFGLVSTFLLLLPNWISSLLYLFFFGIIVITLLRFIRGS